VLRREGKWDQAIASFKHAAELDPRALEHLVDLALTLFITRDYPETERLLHRAAELAPDSPNVYALRMVTYLNWEGSLEKPRRLMQEALGRFEFARFASTQIFDDCFDLVAADDAYQGEVARLTPAAFSGVSLYYLAFKASVYRRRGETAKARAYADSARVEALARIQRHENNVFTYTTLAIENGYLGRGKEAIEAGEEALRVMPPSKDAIFGQEGHVALAEVYMVLGNTGAALDQLRGVLAVPSALSVGRLRGDPLWAPLKADPAFERLVNGK
jgi:tetratricopeptide (TPR) repeat protein